MKEKLFSNLALKLLAVVLGFIVWVAVLNIDDSAVTKQIKDIPIELLNAEAITDQNQLFSITSGDTVDIIIKGRKSVVNTLSREDFLATADMSKISITNAVPISVSAKDEAVKNSISITVVDDVMHVELEEEKTVAVPVTVVTTGQVAEGYIAGNGVATPNLINVKGAESVVSSIDVVEIVVDVTDRTTDVSTNCTPVFKNASGKEISSNAISCDVDNIDVTVPIYRTKKIPVNIETKGNPAAGYVVAAVEYVPETIAIGGESSVINSIKSVDISDIDISGYDSDYETTIDIVKYLPDGVVVSEDNEMVNVKITIEKSVEKDITISADDVSIENKTDNYYYEISFENGQTVKVKGSSEVVSKLKASDLHISVDGQGLSIGTNEVMLDIKDGDGYTVDSVCSVIITVSAMP